MFILTAEQEAAVVEMYTVQCMSGRLIARQLGVSQNTVYRALKRLGIIIADKRQLSPEKAAVAANRYSDRRMSAYEIANELGVFPGAVYGALKRQSIHIRKRDYHVNESFFHSITTEVQAYWLGFIAADGGIFNNTLQVALAVKDAQHLELFRDAIESNHPLRSYSHGVLSHLLIFSKRMVADLIAHGVTPKKSLTIGKVTGIPEPLLRRFFRGLLDGDGCLHKDKVGCWIVSIAGNHPLLQWFLGFIRRSIETKAEVRQQSGQHIFTLNFSGNRLAPRVASLLYADATISLQRKQALYQKMMMDSAVSKHLSSSCQLIL